MLHNDQGQALSVDLKHSYKPVAILWGSPNSQAQAPKWRKPSFPGNKLNRTVTQKFSPTVGHVDEASLDFPVSPDPREHHIHQNNCPSNLQIYKNNTLLWFKPLSFGAVM